MTGKQHRRSYLQTVGAAAVSLGAAGRASAAPQTVIVPDDQPTIQDGVDAVASGGTVEVRAAGGPYAEEVNVGKPVTLVGDPGGDAPGAGADAPVIDGGGATEATGINLYQQGRSPDDVTIRGFSIRNFGVRPDDGEWGKGVSGGVDNERVTIQDCSFREIGAAGVSVTTDGDRAYRDWTVERCRFENCPLAGVRFDHVSDATVRANAFINPSPTPDEYPHIGVYLHANVRDGASGTQSNVDVVANEFRGDSNRSAVWLLAINKNGGETDTLAALRDVRVAGNVFDEMPETPAVSAAANSVRGAPTRLSGLDVVDNTVRGAKAGINLGSAAEGAISDVTVANNDVSAARAGLRVRGKLPAAVTGVTSRDNTYDTDIAGVFVTVHERHAPADDSRYAVDDIRVVGDDITAGEHWGVGVHSNQAHGVGSLVVEGVDSAGKEGIHASGHAPDAVEAVTVSDSRFEGLEGAGMHFSGETNDGGSPNASFLGQVSLTDCSAVGADPPGLALTGKNGSETAPGIGAVSVDGLTVDEGQAVGVFGRGSDALGTVEFRRLTCRGLGGIDIHGMAPGAIHEIAVDDITVDASEGQGVTVKGTHRAGSTGSRPSVGPVSVSNADFTIDESASLVIDGRAPNALGGVDVRDLTVQATNVEWGGVGVLVRGRAPDATGAVSVERAELATQLHGVLVETEGGENAAVELDAADVTVESEEGGGIVVQADESGAVERARLENVSTTTKWFGTLLEGSAADSIETVEATGLDLTARGKRNSAFEVRARTDDAIGTVSVTDLVARSAPDTFTAQVASHGVNGIGSVEASELSLTDGWVGLFCYAGTDDGTPAGIGAIDITDSEFRRNEYGLVTGGVVAGDALTIRETNFVDNEKPPESQYVGYGVANFSTGDGAIDARHNYWGHPSGPSRRHPGSTKGDAGKDEEAAGGEQSESHRDQIRSRRGPPKTVGKGDLVSDGVEFRPWLKEES